MSPSKASSSTSPVKPGFNDFNNPFRPVVVSPTKRESMSPVKDEVRRLSTTDEEDEKMDTRSLLERMKETVEGMKRRRSTLGTSAPSPVKSSTDSNPFENGGIEHFALDSLEIQDDSDEDKENDRNTMDVDEPILVFQSPNKKGAIPLLHREVAEDSVDDDDDDDNDDIPVAPIVVQDSVTVDPPSQLEEAEQPPIRVRAMFHASSLVTFIPDANVYNFLGIESTSSSWYSFSFTYKESTAYGRSCDFERVSSGSHHRGRETRHA
jgi:hypothetical protein